MDKPSIAVAMSGGVDSSVAAALLVESGYRVVGFTMRLWNGEERFAEKMPCCNIEAAKDARKVCDIIGAVHYTVDMRESFRREVLEQFKSEYLAGRTPNPCVRCNSLIKWGYLWEKIRSVGLDRLATGHYARLETNGEKSMRLLKGLDPLKEQSYFLWQIPRTLFDTTLFPLGDKTKPEVRAIARRLNLPVAAKKESLEICFIPNNDYRAWLKTEQPDIESSFYAGEMIDVSGKVLGLHAGYHLFTIGQRKGLGLGGGRKLYITAIDPDTRCVQVGEENELRQSEFSVASLNILSEDLFDNPLKLEVKIRYRDPGVPASVERIGKDRVLVSTLEPVKAVTPGQSAVFYDDDHVLGGGIILND